jgi:hypothetical protein
MSEEHPHTSTGALEFAPQLQALRGRDRLIGTFAETRSLSIRNNGLEAEILSSRQERKVAIADMKASWSWRIGRLIMWPALMVRRIRHSGGRPT